MSVSVLINFICLTFIITAVLIISFLKEKVPNVCPLIYIHLLIT